MIFRTGTRKIIEYDFCPHREYLVARISKGKIISVNWLLCYRFFIDPKPLQITSLLRFRKSQEFSG